MLPLWDQCAFDWSSLKMKNDPERVVWEIWRKR